MSGSFTDMVKGKNVLFLSTKNADYLRNTQEIRILKQYAKRVEVIASPAKSYLKRLLTVYPKLFTKSLKDTDLVFAGFSPQLLLPFFPPRYRRKPLIEDFFLSSYDTYVQDRKKFKDGSLPARILKRWDKSTLKKADRILTDTKAHADYFIRELGADPKKTETLYLEADKSIYYPREKKTKGEAQAPFLVLYFGSVLPLQGVDVLLDAVKRFADDDSIRFEIIGPVPENKKAEGKNIRYIPWLSQEELAEHIAEADLCLAGHFSGTIGKAQRTIPGKAYIYRAMDRPMILGDTPANHELYTEDGRTWFVRPGDPDALAETIRKARQQLTEETNP